MPLFIAAFLYGQRQHLALLLSQQQWHTLFTNFGLSLLLGYLAIFAIAIVGLLSFSRGLIFQKKFTDHARASRVLLYCTRYVLVYFLINIILSRAPEFYLAELFVLTGACLVGFVLIAPRYVENLKGLYDYWTISDWAPHLLLWKEYFAAIGKPLRGRQNGAGLRWYPKFFWRMIPFHSVFWLLGLAGVLFAGVSRGGWQDFAEAYLAIGISVLPILYSELTKGPQFARTSFPIFFGLLFFIGSALFQSREFLFPFPFFSLVLGSAITISAAWNLWVFWRDIFPSRMAASTLVRLLRSLNVDEFFTYHTVYNDAFVSAMRQEDAKKYKIHSIQTLSEVQDGYIVVPPTSSKAVSVESDQYAIRRGDFKEDPLLDQLICSRAIEKAAVAQIKTVGASRFWAQESDATSYRDLIAHDISDTDRYRGYAWILDVKKLLPLLGKA